MKKISILLTLLCFLLMRCKGQVKYFQPTGIVDKTKVLSGKNEWASLNNKESVDGYTRIGDSIFGGEIACNVKPLPNIDVKTFQVLAGTKYARDTNHIYYPLQTVCIDYSDCGVCYYSKIIVENADPAAFRYLGKDYATDGHSVFFRGEVLPGADGASFKVIEGPAFFYFATDKQHVYKHNQVSNEADPATFYFDKHNPKNIVSEAINVYIIGDKNKKWEYTPPDQLKLLPAKRNNVQQ